MKNRTSHKNSVEKIVKTYMSGVCKEQFEYMGEVYKPKQIIVSPLIFKGFTCPSACGGCCLRFSLDYLPDSALPYALPIKEEFLNDKKILLRSELQEDPESRDCMHLDTSTGRCNIHKNRPFSCDFELIRFVHSAGRVQIRQQLYGRGWAMKKIDGERGASCIITPPTAESVAEVVRKFEDLDRWCGHFGVQTWIKDKILPWLRTGPHETPLRISGPGTIPLHLNYK